MKLLLRTKSGELLEFDLLPDDTFNDLSQRLLEHGDAVVNIIKLSSQGRPFEMSANVIEYVTALKQIIRSTEKQNDSENIDDGVTDNPDNNIISENKENNKGDKESFDLKTCKDDLEASIEPLVCSCKKKDKEKKRLICRLCAQATDSVGMNNLYDRSNDESMTLADKINISLPINVKEDDGLPKQICADCKLQLETSYKFAKVVLRAEGLLLADEMDFQVNPNEGKAYDCQLWDGHNLTECEEKEFEKDRSNKIEPKIIPERNFSQQNNSVIRNLKSTDDEKDRPAKDELKTIKKRGRPKGAPNKKKDSIKVVCIMCERVFFDISSVLAHSLRDHCEDGSTSLPCPLCPSVWPEKGELENHVNSHATNYQIIINPCILCPKQFKEKEELQQHFLKDHVKQQPSTFHCPACSETFQCAQILASHIAENHMCGCNTSSWGCPICHLPFGEKVAFFHHFLTTHSPRNETVYDCPKCEEKLNSDIDLASHLMESHCELYMIQIPLQYKCPGCNAKFKSQYRLIKHPCSGIGKTNLYCEECAITFPFKARYMLHLQFHTDPQNFELRCDICLAKFSEEESFYDHIRMHRIRSRQTKSSTNEEIQNRTL